MYRPLVLILTVAATVPIAFGEASSPQKSGTVRIVSWEAFGAHERLSVIPKSSFDVLLPLADIPADATARQVADLAKDRVGVRYMVRAMVRLYRWLDSEGVFVRLASSRSSHQKSVELIRNLRDGDVLVFHGIWDDFGVPSPTPNQAMERTATRCAFTSYVTTTRSLWSTRAPGDRRSSYSR